MREAIGTSWIYQLVLIFILIFASYLALTINYSKAFKVKNETLNIIEKNEGLRNETINTVNNYLRNSGYSQTGICPDGYMGVDDITATTSSALKEAKQGTKYYWCIYKNTGYNYSYPGKSYYKIRMFFKFDLPVIGQITTFNVDGQTYEMDFTYDD